MHRIYEELYLVRGLAIIGVVVCHQINFLHTSNWINCFTIFSVSALIFCAGITKEFSLRTYVVKKNLKNQPYNWVGYTFTRLKSILISYSICCVV